MSERQVGATDDSLETKLRPSMFHGAWDGCAMEIEFDSETIEDVIIHDAS
jgi:hypothetical protein